jgi:hypothetical protein
MARRLCGLYRDLLRERTGPERPETTAPHQTTEAARCDPVDSPGGTAMDCRRKSVHTPSARLPHQAGEAGIGASIPGMYGQSSGGLLSTEGRPGVLSVCCLCRSPSCQDALVS